MPPEPSSPSSPDRLPLMIDLSSQEVTPDERELLAERRIAGVCLFGRNVRDKEQVADYVAELRALAGEELVIAVDQEGGGVLRLFDVPAPPAAMALGSADDTELTHAVARAAGRGLRAVGINLDFAPVADVNSNPMNPVIADRSFGSEPDLVSRHVVAFLTGLQVEGVGAALKHFPGHGDTGVDSHLALPTIEKNLDDLQEIELKPFRSGIEAGVAAVMSAHIVLPALDAEMPATLSAAALKGLLRGELGFDGLVVTDALDMRAIADRWPAPDASVLALAAGADLPLTIGTVAQHRETLNAIARAGADRTVDLREPRRRLSEFVRRFPAPSPDPASAWQDGDVELLEEAALRGLVVQGDVPRLASGSTVLLLARDEVRASAAAQVTVRPAAPLRRELEGSGLSVRFLDVEGASDRDVAGALAGVAAAVYASTTRVAPSEAEIETAVALERAAKATGVPYVHVALWNPYTAQRVPGPSIVAFGFRDLQARAVVHRLTRGG